MCYHQLWFRLFSKKHTGPVFSFCALPFPGVRGCLSKISPRNNKPGARSFPQSQTAFGSIIALCKKGPEPNKSCSIRVLLWRRWGNAIHVHNSIFSLVGCIITIMSMVFHSSRYRSTHLHPPVVYINSIG